jgi:hypothetical protein
MTKIINFLANTQLLFSAIALLLLPCCKDSDNERFKQEIIGDWKFVEAEVSKDIDLVPLPPFMDGNQKQGFVFYENGICENKRGYFKKINKQIFFLGTKTKYKIENDYVKIMNLNDSVWTNFKICSLDLDTLILTGKDSLLVKYAREKYTITEKTLFDKIIVSSSGCYGICPISDVCIDQQGNVIFSGQFYNTKNGLYTSIIDRKQYLEIESNFKKSNIAQLHNNYSSDWSDEETVFVTFIKNNKIIKTISDYGRQAPAEFYWAYMPVQYLYQHLELAPYINSIDLPIYVYNIKLAGKTCELTKSEGFFLLSEIYKGTNTQYNFKEKYDIQCYDYKTMKMVHIYSDGRYYKCKQLIGNSIIDIGYNFIDYNNLEQRF